MNSPIFMEFFLIIMLIGMMLRHFAWKMEKGYVLKKNGRMHVKVPVLINILMVITIILKYVILSIRVKPLNPELLRIVSADMEFSI